MRVSPRPGKTVCLMRVGSQWVVGENDTTKTSPKLRRVYKDGVVKYTHHAEARALQLARRLGGRIREVVVMRWTKGGNLSIAKPCVFCASMLEAEGVKKRDVFYSDWRGDVVCAEER